jgi:hypothetical protein
VNTEEPEISTKECTECGFSVKPAYIAWGYRTGSHRCDTAREGCRAALAASRRHKSVNSSSDEVPLASRQTHSNTMTLAMIKITVTIEIPTDIVFAIESAFSH